MVTNLPKNQEIHHTWLFLAWESWSLVSNIPLYKCIDNKLMGRKHCMHLNACVELQTYSSQCTPFLYNLDDYKDQERKIQEITLMKDMLAIQL